MVMVVILVRSQSDWFFVWSSVRLSHFSVCILDDLFHVQPIADAPQAATSTSHALQAAILVVFDVESVHSVKAAERHHHRGTQSNVRVVLLFVHLLRLGRHGRLHYSFLRKR